MLWLNTLRRFPSGNGSDKWSSWDVRRLVNEHVGRFFSSFLNLILIITNHGSKSTLREQTHECQLHKVYCLTPACGAPASSMACSIRQPRFPLLQNGYRDGDRAPALVPVRRSQQLANVNLPDTHSGVGAPRQQQFSTACEWDWRAICWPKSLIISTSLSGGGWRMGRQRGEPGGNKGREQKDDTKWLPDVAAQRGEKGSWWFAAQRTGGQIHCGTIHGRA